MKIVNPAGVRREDRPQLAPRPPALAGLRLGLLHNGKPGGEPLLRRLAARLADEDGVAASSYWRKPHPSTRATFLEELGHDADVVLGALSD